MNSLNMIIKELFGLFVDDGSLAYATLGLLGVIALLVHEAVVDSNLAGVVFVAGVIIVLIENVVRTAKR